MQRRDLAALAALDERGRGRNDSALFGNLLIVRHSQRLVDNALEEVRTGRYRQMVDSRLLRVCKAVPWVPQVGPGGGRDA